MSTFEETDRLVGSKVARRHVPQPTAHNCLVRVGCYGQVGRFRVVDPSLYLRRGDRVACRTARGLEVGQVLNSDLDHQDGARVDGQLLRKLDAADRLLWDELQRLAIATLEAGRRWLAQENSDAVLIEVEPLLDGRTLYFHFLSDVPDAVQIELQKLTDIFEQQVAKSGLTQQLEVGCGPGCGTSDAAGCGTTSGGCAVCVRSSTCH
ncbi:MAG: hypothetical protein KatS3mg111_4117 [Pirellulaceae bacterium]|nr:MAG: hypothetical protein KatS3mg111_4117 [Pirellulaceae bacterium]